MKVQIKLINSDQRGELYGLYIDDKEYLIMETKKNYRRGGDYHNSIQHDIVLKGKIKVMSPEKELILVEGQKSEFEPGEPHYIEALEDSVVIEWLSGPFEKKYYVPYRKIVEECLK